ncbi:MAG: hypothetical protein ACOVLE_06740, partial [Pirellula staleyi]
RKSVVPLNQQPARLAGFEIPQACPGDLLCFMASRAGARRTGASPNIAVLHAVRCNSISYNGAVDVIML